MSIDLREHDQRHHATQPTDSTLDFHPDEELALRIRDGLRTKREAEAFAAADRRMMGRDELPEYV